MSRVPIAEHALLSDRHSAALVTSGGSIDWLCFPRFDSASVFAAILDDDAGHWSIRPVGEFTSERSYIDGTMVLRTVFDTADGRLELVDAMELGPSTDPHRLGEYAPHGLLRGLHCTHGRVPVAISFAPRPEYGLVLPRTTLVEGGVRVVGGPDRFTLASAYQLREQLGELDPSTRTFLTGLADAAAAQWQRTDNGIWEVRGVPRHFLYSTLMCWVALDRAAAMAEQLHAGARAAGWAAEAERIREAILRRGWNDDVGAFTQTLDGTELDASALMIPIVGLLPATDPRVQSTIDAVAAQLTDDRGLVYRYHAAGGVDGLDGEEGTFLLCTFWLAQALAMAGRTRAARAVFARAAAYANDVGLLAEEIDPGTGEQLGNMPQAFSHIGLVNAAWAIHRAELEEACTVADDGA